MGLCFAPSELVRLPPPLWGRAGVWGATSSESPWSTPLPVPPPQGERERWGVDLLTNELRSPSTRSARHADLPSPPHRADGADSDLRVAADLFAAASIARRSGAGDGRRGARSGGDRADQEAVPARPADPGAIRLLGQGRAVGRSRRIAADQDAGPRSHPTEAAGDPAARIDGDRDRLPDRGSRRH